ncbi:MAG: AraC family transcriptional regulator [Bacteroides sp.]
MMEEANNKLFDKLNSIVQNLKGQRLADVFRFISFVPTEKYFEHQHHRIEINYVKKGSCIIQLQNESISFKEDDLMIICPDVIHSFQAGNDGCTLMQLEFLPEVFDDFTSVLAVGESDLFTPLSLFSATNSVIKIVNNVRIMRAIQRIVTELNTKKAYYDYLVLMYYAELLILIYRHMDEAYLPIGSNPAMTKAIRFIRENFKKEISITQVADEAQISERYLRKIFAEHLNLAPIEYLNQIRINHAIELLRISELSIKEICYESGFQSPQYFSRIFKKQVGVNPRKINHK